MLDTLEARRTLYEAISAAVGVLVPASAQAFPGVAVDTGTLPRLEVVHVSARHPTMDLKGNVYAEEGVVQVFVVGQKGNGTATLPARFSGLTGYGTGALDWNDSWSDTIKVWARQNVGYWTDANGFAGTTADSKHSIWIW